MPALDQCHDNIVNALKNAGWEVEPAPLRLDLATRHLFVDILAKRTNEDSEQQIIVVEAKCFANEDKETTELYTAIGQYIVYRSIIQQLTPDLTIYLAVPTYAYHGIFKEIGIDIFEKENIKLIVINLEEEQIEDWI